MAEPWAQDFLERGECELRNVGGEGNSADMFMETLSREVLERHPRYLGRHAAQPGGTPEGVSPEGCVWMCVTYPLVTFLEHARAQRECSTVDMRVEHSVDVGRCCGSRSSA